MSRAAGVAFVALGLIWGSNFIFMKWASETVSAGQITLVRVLFGFLPVLVYALVRRTIKRRHLRHAHHFLVMSLLATSVYAFAAGTALLPSGIAGALSGAIPLFTFVSALLFLRTERVTALRFLGVLIGFSGVLLIARPWETEGGVDLVGVTYMLLGAASVGVSFVYARKFVSPLGIAPAALTTYQIGLALPLSRRSRTCTGSPTSPKTPEPLLEWCSDWACSAPVLPTSSITSSLRISEP